MRVFIIAPAHVVTGGVELLHQFSRSLSDNNIENYMVYQNVEKEDSLVPEVYQKYNVKYADVFIDDYDSILVLPEGWVGEINDIECIKGTVMVWWLSVDNYLAAYARTIEKYGVDCFNLKSFKNIVHFVQSNYAKDFIENQIGIEKSYFLTDYISDDIIRTAKLYQNLKYDRKNICLYNPQKGYEVIPPLIEACRKDIVWMPLIGYKPMEMAALMCIAKVYVDFGNHPGKDRIPREAAACGCCVLTNRKGSAAYQEDVGIPEHYKINGTEEVDDILEKIYSLIDCYDEKKEEFSEYRLTVYGEKEKFVQEVKETISILKTCVEKQKGWRSI